MLSLDRFPTQLSNGLWHNGLRSLILLLPATTKPIYLANGAVRGLQGSGLTNKNVHCANSCIIHRCFLLPLFFAYSVPLLFVSPHMIPCSSAVSRHSFFLASSVRLGYLNPGSTLLPKIHFVSTQQLPAASCRHFDLVRNTSAGKRCWRGCCELLLDILMHPSVLYPFPSSFPFDLLHSLCPPLLCFASALFGPPTQLSVCRALFHCFFLSLTHHPPPYCKLHTQQNGGNKSTGGDSLERKSFSSVQNARMLTCPPVVPGGLGGRGIPHLDTGAQTALPLPSFFETKAAKKKTKKESKEKR